MTPQNLIRDYLGMQKIEEFNETTLTLLAGVVDQTKDGYVNFFTKIHSDFPLLNMMIHDLLTVHGPF